jgi:alpha-amylase
MNDSGSPARRVATALACLAVALACGGCSATRKEAPVASAPTAAPPMAANTAPAWHDRVFYEVFVRSFADSTSGPLASDGIGDLRGLIERLDYLNDGNPATRDDLGVSGIWLMPINPSPSYHGYDVTDYYDVNPEYGTKEDFRRLIQEAHRRGISVIMDLVLNHTSSEHPDFKRALAGDRAARGKYIFVDAPPQPVYLGPWGQTVWQEMQGQHYFGIFWSGMPDLNYRNPEVSAEARRIAQFWLEDMGVDGFRLDAVRHLIEDGREMSDTPETLAWLAAFNADVARMRAHALTVGEIWTHTETVSDYVNANAVDLAFEFDLAGAFLDAVTTGSKATLAYTLDNVTQSYPGQRYASFLTNHDQDRVMSVLQGDVGPAKLAASLLLTAPGVPFIYYGEEIGLTGRKPDERIRTPMPWTNAPNGGFTRSRTPWEALESGYEQRNVAAEARDPASLESLYRRLIGLRNAHAALRGSYRAVETGRDDVIAWERTSDGETLFVIANLGARPVETQTLAAGAVPAASREWLHDERVEAGRLEQLAPRTLYVLER